MRQHMLNFHQSSPSSLDKCKLLTLVINLVTPTTPTEATLVCPFFTLCKVIHLGHYWGRGPMTLKFKLKIFHVAPTHQISSSCV